MLRVKDFCIDRWEVSLVDRRSGEPLSPFYPPAPALCRAAREYWELERTRVGDESARRMPLPDLPAFQLESFEPLAVSLPGVVPQGYMSYLAAKRACENANKRLCKKDEWQTACRGSRRTKFPYGAQYLAGRCNVFRLYHPAQILHGNASLGHRDPRLNLVIERGQDPVLRPTGATEECASYWENGAAYDMVGNLDEWVDENSGVMMGGFYARATSKGCEAQITVHGPSYYDYSTGTRCCRSLQVEPKIVEQNPEGRESARR